MRELQRFDVMLNLAERDYEVYSGRALEWYFRWKFIEEKKYTRMDSWWDRKGENEIDLVCEDDVPERLDFFEVKCDPRCIDLDKLKSIAFFARKKNGAENDFFHGLVDGGHVGVGEVRREGFIPLKIVYCNFCNKTF